MKKRVGLWKAATPVDSAVLPILLWCGKVSFLLLANRELTPPTFKLGGAGGGAEEWEQGLFGPFSGFFLKTILVKDDQVL